MARNGMFTFLLIALAAAQAGLADPLPSGTLHVSSSPGVRVYVDNQFAGLTTADQAGLRVSALLAGEHQVRVEKIGYKSKRFVVVIKEGADVELKVGKLDVRPRIRRKPLEEPVDITVGSPPMVIDDTSTPRTARNTTTSPLATSGPSAGNTHSYRAVSFFASVNHADPGSFAVQV